MAIVQGIKLSTAALLVENAFRDILGYDNDQIRALSGDDRLERHCDNAALDAMLEYIRTDSERGLQSLTPPRTIVNAVIHGVGLDSTISGLIILISDNAFFEVEEE